MAQLQHHFKFGAIYSIYYRILMALENFRHFEDDKKINPNYEKKYTVLADPEKAKRMCQETGASWDTWLTNITNQHDSKPNVSVVGLFDKAAKMSEQLMGPDAEDAFNCDHYEEHLICLHRIAKLIKAEKVLVDDIEKYLLPYRQEKKFSSKNEDWDETYTHLQHSPTNNNFGSYLKEMTETYDEDSSIFPDTYAFKCHGQ